MSGDDQIGPALFLIGNRNARLSEDGYGAAFRQDYVSDFDADQAPPFRPGSLDPLAPTKGADLLDAVRAMTDAERAELRALLGLPEPPPAPHPRLWLPDGRGGFAAPGVGRG